MRILALLAALAAASAPLTALAQPWVVGDVPPPADLPRSRAPVVIPPPLPALPPNVVTAPDGGVSVTRTPQQGVDVHAPTTAGTVHAYGCNRVDVDPRTAVPATAPCAAPQPYYVPYYPAPVAYYAPYAPYTHRQRAAPKHRPDSARRGALIGSSLLFGLGTAGAGTAFLSSVDYEKNHGGDPSKPALYLMGGFLTLTPSIPRVVVGDVGMALLLTGLRGGSFAAGALIDWEDESHVLPTTLAFVVPATLAIIDLATTPHREDLEPKRETESAGVKLRGVGPTAVLDQRGDLAPAVGALGTF